MYFVKPNATGILILRFLEREAKFMTYTEISAATKIPHGTVEVQCYELFMAEFLEGEVVTSAARRSGRVQRMYFAPKGVLLEYIDSFLPKV